MLNQLYISAGWIKQARQVNSPNYNLRPPGMSIDAIIIHGISLPPGKFGGNFIDDFFLNQLDTSRHPFFKQIVDLSVSAHCLIRRDGELVQYVNLLQRAWHAGKSSLAGRENCNDFSIGIELEGIDTLAYDLAQYETLIALVHSLRQTFPLISQERIVGHEHIAPGRKTDPGESFDWDYFRRRLANKKGSG